MSKKLLTVMLVVLISGVTAQAISVNYEADVMPVPDGWTYDGGSGGEGSVSGGIYSVSHSSSNYTRYKRTIATDYKTDDAGALMSLETSWKNEAGKTNDWNQLWMIVNTTGTSYTQAKLTIKNGQVELCAGGSSYTHTMTTTDAFHTYLMTVGVETDTEDEHFNMRMAKLYVDGSFAGEAETWRYSATAGQLHWGNNSSGDAEGFEVDYVRFSEVPEPATMALLGLGGLLLRRRKA